MTPRTTFAEWAEPLVWLDRSPLVIEPYRRRLFAQAFDTVMADGRPQYNLILSGRAKKNHKTLDLVLAALFSLVENDTTHGSQCYVLANDEDQASDDLDLAKKLIRVNPGLESVLTIQRKVIVRKDAGGFLEVLPANDVRGAHGKTFRFCGHDEIHGQKDWGIFEAMQPDPHRPDVVTWITSYASLHHRPGVPLFDLMARGRGGLDPRFLFSWYAADYCSDPAFRELGPEARANPSIATFTPGYLDQQRLRLPAFQFRRLHLNLPGLPAGSAYTVEAVQACISRGTKVVMPERGRRYWAFIDMSGGQHDDCVMAIGYVGDDGELVVALVMNQGPDPGAGGFDPNAAIPRFVTTMQDYGVHEAWLDGYAGGTFMKQLETHGITGRLVGDVHRDIRSKSDLYQAYEAVLSSGRPRMPDIPKLEEQTLALIWRGAKIDHPVGENEFDDWANAAIGLAVMMDRIGRRPKMFQAEGDAERARLAQQQTPAAPAPEVVPDHDLLVVRDAAGATVEKWRIDRDHWAIVTALKDFATEQAAGQRIGQTIDATAALERYPEPSVRSCRKCKQTKATDQFRDPRPDTAPWCRTCEAPKGVKR